MNKWLIIILIIVTAIICGALSQILNFNITAIVILLTSAWAAYDFSKLELIKYKSGISYNPVVLFIGCAMLWIVGFPWYLIMREKIKSGNAELKVPAETAA